MVRLGVGGIDLDELCEVAAVAEGGLDCAQTRLESISADLEALRGGRMPKALNKGVRRGLVASAQGEVENPQDSDTTVRRWLSLRHNGIIRSD